MKACKETRFRSLDVYVALLSPCGWSDESLTALCSLSECCKGGKNVCIEFVEDAGRWLKEKRVRNTEGAFCLESDRDMFLTANLQRWR